VSAAPLDARRLRNIRAGARATLALGILASLAANVLAAQPTVIGRVISTWPPVALLLTIELLSRVPVAPGWLSRLRVVSAAGIAGIAAWVSYWHVVAVASDYGEATVAAHLLPLSVDGLVVVASVCLAELGRPQAEGTAEPVGAAASEPDDESEPTPADRPRSRPRRRPTARPAAPMRDVVLRLAEDHPDWTQARIADAAGCSVRTVRRHLNDPEPTAPTPPVPDVDPPALPALVASTNGHTPEAN
jgi:hypothetical protein